MGNIFIYTKFFNTITLLQVVMVVEGTANYKNILTLLAPVVNAFLDVR